MTYQKLFAPDTVVTFRADGAEAGGGADQREGSVYVYTPEIILAVNVALATRRPLLVRGPSGGGKSSLARNVANFLKYRYYEVVISSRTQARDLLWEIDLLRRLHDAQIRDAAFDGDLNHYVVPGVLWWAFDSETALAHRPPAADAPEPEPDAQPDAPPQPDAEAKKQTPAVVLIDEIDKADPDVPNNLLVPLGSLQFEVEETGEVVKTTPETAPLVFITTNDERELPAAFLRRCVEVVLPHASDERLVEIGRAHFPDLDVELLRTVAAHIGQSVAATGKGGEVRPSPAEYLDTLRVCERLHIEPESDDWKNVVQMTLWKQKRRPGEYVAPQK
jgi:MoxR-like ATPase